MQGSHFTRIFVLAVLALVIAVTGFHPGLSTVRHQGSFDGCGFSLDTLLSAPLVGWNSSFFFACPEVGWNS
jgi:hypothetical protein